jgi:penicillin-binding protein 1A
MRKPDEARPGRERTATGRRPRRRSLAFRLVRAALIVVVLLALAGAAGVAAVWAHFSRGLPDVPVLAKYRPPVVTEIVSGDGQLAGELFVERRKVVPYEGIPRRLVQAFIASEDQDFFVHRGVDPIGILRAAVRTYVLRGKVQGGSTITQQTAKSLLVSAEGFEEGTRRNLRRKVRELILARRLEAKFSKEDILFLYLNGVYLGHHSYGVQSAAENYFRKNVEDLTLAEAALLAGLPQAPSRYSPFAHPDQAKARRRYVLRRMAEDGYITEEERRQAEGTEVKVHGRDDVFREVAPFYAEHVRRLAVERLGNERLLRDGLRIEAAMDLERQRAAQAAVLEGLLRVDQRQGFWGPVTRVAGKERATLQGRLEKAWPKGAFAPGGYAVGIVTAVDAGAALVRVQVGGNAAVLPLAGMRWARRPNPTASWQDAQLSRVGTVLADGDVVVVRRTTRADLLAREREAGRKGDVPEAPILVALAQEPRLQGALVSIEPWSGYVPAMVGGYDFDASEFNRAFQACRQPGSAFKPIVYAWAIDKLGFTPATILTDAPVVYRDAESGVSWKPENFSSDFRGDVTLREALVHSLNIPAVKVAAALGPDEVVNAARILGLSTPVKRELGSAIGSSCTTLWDLANVYATLDRYGEKRPATFLKRVVDRDGRVLEDHVSVDDPWAPLTERLAAAAAAVRAQPERVLDERSAYITVHLLHEVARVGTGAQAAKLGKPAAGKTGTTNDSFDTWFMGFTRGLVAGVWLGFDQNEMPLGRAETGGRAALPIWLEYMQAALGARPQPEFIAPDGIVVVNMDPRTGKLAEAGGVPAPFKIESQPVEEPEAAPDKPRVDVRDLFGQ